MACTGPIRAYYSRAYRLIELSFACVSCPTTADAVICAPKAPLCKGSCQLNRLTEGLSLREQPLRAKSKILLTSPYTGEAFRCGGIGHSESFLEPLTLPVVFFIQEKPPSFLTEVCVFALLIFPGSRPPSIVSANELNFCVRDGNRWTLIAINTNYLYPRLLTD